MLHHLKPEPGTVAILALLIALAVVLGGCGTRSDTNIEKQGNTVAKARTVTKEVIRKTPLANGGEVIERTLTTDVVSDENTSHTSRERMETGLDAGTTSMANTLGQVAGAAVSMATGAPVGDWVATSITGAITAAVAGYGALKAGQNKQLREERDFHKDDAEKGWARALEPKQPSA